MPPDEASSRADRLVLLKKLGEAAAHGDVDAFEQLHTCLRGGILCFFQRRGADGVQAEDLSQLAWAAFWRRISNRQFNPVMSPETYILGICDKLWKDELRRSGRRKRAIFTFAGLLRSSKPGHESGAGTSAWGTELEVIEALRECCRASGAPWSLTDDQRLLLYELFCKDGSLRSVGSLLGIVASTVSDRERKALDKLRRCLVSKGYPGFDPEQNCFPGG